MDVVPAAQLLAEWVMNEVFSKRAGGALLERIVHRTQATNPRYSGGESRIVKLVTESGQHIGTLHEIVLPDGTVVHTHPKDYTRRDCSRIRADWVE